MCRIAPVNPWLLSEELSEVSAKNYLQGKTILFGKQTRREWSKTEI
jgi:hypothetical protein